MLRADLLELIRDGENSGVEFKRDAGLTNVDLAKAVVAFANLRGGRVLIGVEDNGAISGVSRPEAEEWVLTACRDKIRPPVVPYVERVRDALPGRDVLVVTFDPGYAVHAVWHHNHLTPYMRVGRQTREPGMEELARLQQQRGAYRAEIGPVPGTGIKDIDLDLARDYFVRVRGQDAPERSEAEDWVRLLTNTEFMVEGVTGPVCALAGVLVFGRSPGALVPHAAVDAVAFPGAEKDYAARERATLRAPLMARIAADGSVLAGGLVERALEFCTRNLPATAVFDGPRRRDRPAIPPDVLREAVVNAVVHRDYALTASDIELSIFADRLELVSPGRLPHGVTVERMLVGVRAARNQVLKDTMRDLGYVENIGLGVPRKIVKGMREHNGTEPEYEEIGEHLRLRLRY